MRSGVIAKKVGMTRLFMDDGRQVPVTVLQMENLQVVAQRTAERDGYTAVQLGAGTVKAKNVTKQMRGHFATAKVEPKRKVAEFRVSSDNLIGVGEEITADHYIEGQFVDIAGTSIGKGFAGTTLVVFGRPTVFQSRIARTALRANVRILAGFSKVRKWLAIWVLRG